MPETPGEAGAGDTGEAAAQPRRCAEPERDGEGRAWPCDAALSGIDCSVCSGSRCYGHCGSVDHMGGTLYVEFGAEGFTARVRCIREGGGEFDMGRYAGHLRSDRTGRVICKGIEADDPEEVLRELRELIPRASTPPVAAAPRPACRREADAQRTVRVAAQILAAANACPCEGCKAIVRLFNLIVVPAAQAAGKAVQ